MTTSHFSPIQNNQPAVPATWNNPMGELDQAINTHDHNPGIPDSGGDIDHSFLTNSGSNTHAAIDAHIGSTGNPHQVSLSQASAVGGNISPLQVRADAIEAATNDVLGPSSTLQNNLNRLRYRLNQFYGTAGVTSSLTGHTHNPSISGDGGMVVQTGVQYDSSEQEIPTGQTSLHPSILDNLGHIRYDLRQLKNGIGFADQSITSAHIQNKALTSLDLADRSVDENILGWGAVAPRNMKACRVSARSDAATKSLVVDIDSGVYYLGSQTAITAGKQTFSFAGLLPSIADVARIDVLYMDSVGQVLRQAGTPGANPSPPVAPNDTLPLAQVYLRGVASTTVSGIYDTNADTGFTPNDSYIYRDIRPFLNLSGTGGGGGTTLSRWEPVVNATPTTSANGTNTTFTMSDTFIANTTSVTVNGTIYQRVASGATGNQYVEGVALNTIIFPTAPANGAAVRVSYFKGSSNPINNMVWSSTPGGTINGTNLAFTTTDAFIAGTLIVFEGTSTTDQMERLIPGVHYTEDTSLTGFTFTAGNAPPTGSILRAQYARADFATNNADSVDGFHASATATANTLLPLNSSSQLPASVTGSSVSLANPGNAAAPFYPSLTATANQIPVVNATSGLVLPGLVQLPIGSAYRITKNGSDSGTDPRMTTAGTVTNTTLRVVVGTGGLEVRDNADANTLFFVANGGTITYSINGITLPNTAPATFTKNTTGNNSILRMSSGDIFQIVGANGGVGIRNNADTSTIWSIDNTGNVTGTGNLSAIGASFSTLAISGTTTLTGAVTTSGNVTVGGTLTAQAASGSVPGLLSTTFFNLLNGATDVATANTLVKRTAGGYIYGTYINTTAGDNLTSQPYMLFGRTSADGFIRTFNPAYATVGWANALAPGQADRIKLDALNTTTGTDPNSWSYTYTLSGKRIFSRRVLITPPASAETSLFTTTAPYGYYIHQGSLQYSVAGISTQAVTFGMRYGAGAGTGNPTNQTQFQITARDRDGSLLSTRSDYFSIELVFVEN